MKPEQACAVHKVRYVGPQLGCQQVWVRSSVVYLLWKRVGEAVGETKTGLLWSSPPPQYCYKGYLGNHPLSICPLWLAHGRGIMAQLWRNGARCDETVYMRDKWSPVEFLWLLQSKVGRQSQRMPLCVCTTQVSNRCLGRLSGAVGRVRRDFGLIGLRGGMEDDEKGQSTLSTAIRGS